MPPAEAPTEIEQRQKRMVAVSVSKDLRLPEQVTKLRVPLLRRIAGAWIRNVFVTPQRWTAVYMVNLHEQVYTSCPAANGDRRLPKLLTPSRTFDRMSAGHGGPGRGRPGPGAGAVTVNSVSVTPSRRLGVIFM